MIFYKSRLFLMILLAIMLLVFFLWQNNHIVTTRFDYVSSRILKDFDGFTLVQISDLHNKSFGRDQKRLLRKIENSKPDIILITGDLIDRRRYKLETAMVFIRGAIKIAPVYYVPGNHEAWSGKYESIKSSLVHAGVIVLDDDKIEIVRGGETIDIIGLKDPGFLNSNNVDGKDMFRLEKTLMDLSDENRFQILLSHRPELFFIYARNKIDLSFTGHAHGGQFRLPFLGGLIAPAQGLFPDYTSGMHSKGNSTMLVSRGLGNSIIPVRIFNRPEIIELVLKSSK